MRRDHCKRRACMLIEQKANCNGYMYEILKTRKSPGDGDGSGSVGYCRFWMLEMSSCMMLTCRCPDTLTGGGLP